MKFDFCCGFLQTFVEWKSKLDVKVLVPCLRGLSISN